MATFNHTNVGAATLRTQYARAAEVQDGTIFKAGSPGGTIDAMTGTLAPAIAAYAANMIVSIIAPGSASNTVTGPTIALNGLAAKTIKKNSGALAVGDYTAGDALLMIYDGTAFELITPPKVPTVAAGSITTAMLSTGAAVIPWIDGGGTADAITGTYSPAIAAVSDGMSLTVRATAANATTTPTFSPNGLTARVIVKNGGDALVAGDIQGDQHDLLLKYDGTNTRWNLMNPKIGASNGTSVFNNGGSFEVAKTRNAQTGTTYTFLTTDRGKHVTLSNGSAIAVTLPQVGSAGFGNSWWCIVESIGAGLATITPTTSTINGLTTLLLDKNCAYVITADGTNYRALQFGRSMPLTIAAGGAVETNDVGFRVVPQNAQPNDYTFVMSDAGKQIFHDDAATHTYTIPANGSVAFPIGTAITIINNTSGGTLTLAITTDTLRRGDGTAGTGSRTIAADRVCTIVKTKSTEWFIAGSYT